MSFQKNSSPLFVESDEFSGRQMTGPEMSSFFVYAAQILEVLSSIRCDKLRKKTDEKRHGLQISGRMKSRHTILKGDSKPCPKKLCS